MEVFKKLRSLLEKTEEKVGIVRQFRIYSLVVMVIIGWLIISSLNTYIKKDAVDRLADSAFIFGKSISHHIENLDLDKPLSIKDYKELNVFVKKQLLHSKEQADSDLLLRLSIYSRRGIERYPGRYSTRPSISHAGHVRYVSQALEGQISHKVSDLSSSKERKRFGSLLKVYPNLGEVAEIHIPLYQNESKPQGVAKLDLNTSLANQYVRKSIITVVIIVVLGLIFLYLSLSWFFYRAHRRISKKNDELNRLTDKVMYSLKELEESYLGTMQALTMAVDAKDHYTAGHSFRVASFAKEIGRVLGFTEEALENLEKGARFHDIGKIGIKETVLNKHGTLTSLEFTEMQKHTVIGAKIIESVKSLQSIVHIVRSHHERVDGNGYPDKLKLESIPMEARIVAVADCFDAMTTDRPNRRAYPASKAIEQIKKESGSHFDKEVVEAFLKAYSGQQLWETTEILKKHHKKSA